MLPGTPSLRVFSAVAQATLSERGDAGVLMTSDPGRE
jgi:hypothetical protein